MQAPSRTDPTAAPAGKDSVMVLLPVANMAERGGDKGACDLGYAVWGRSLGLVCR